MNFVFNFLFVLFLFVSFHVFDAEGWVIGKRTTAEKFPYVVSIYYYKDLNLVCSGSILNQRIVLTTNYGQHWYRSSERFVVAGSDILNVAHDVKVNVSKFIHHKCFKLVIALMFLARDLPLGDKVQRVLISKRFPKYVTRATVAGFGLLSNTEKEATYLRYAELKIISQEKCYCILNQTKYIDETFIKYPGYFCAQVPIEEQSGKGYNVRDYKFRGAPLVVKGYHQIGLFALTTEVDSTILPVLIFTNVSYFYNWIVTKSAEYYCKKT